MYKINGEHFKKKSMEQLIKITTNEQGSQVVSARELHKLLEVKNHFTQWFDDNKSMFEENIDYQAIKVFLTHSNGIGGTNQIDYAVTLDCAKELAMMSKVEKAKDVRKYFIECEKKLKNGNLPTTYLDALKQLVQTVEKNQLLLEQNSKQEALLLEQAPKVEFFDAVTGSEDLIDLGSASKVLNLGYGRNTLFEKLRNLNILMPKNQPYQSMCQKDYFRVIETSYTKGNGDTHIYLKTMVTQKGLDFIRKKLAE